jgi:hypothetical protein
MLKVELDTDIQEFVFNWLRNNLMVSGLKVSLVDDNDVTALEEKLVQVESERDNLILEVTYQFQRITKMILFQSQKLP